MQDKASGAGGEVARIGIVGAGVMGIGIAQIAAQAGLEVRLYDVRDGEAAGESAREHAHDAAHPEPQPDRNRHHEAEERGDDHFPLGGPGADRPR